MFYFTGVNHQYVSVSHSRFTGTLGNCLTAYHITDSVWEHISLDNADFTGNTSGQNSHGAFYFKDGGQGTTDDQLNSGFVSNFTFRNINAWDGVNWTGIIAPLGVNHQGDAQWVEACYCTLDGGIKSPSNSFWSIDHVFLYRNSLTADIFGAEPDAYSDLIAEYNVFANDAGVANTAYLDENNMSETTPFDDSLQLSGVARTSYLGVYGAEVE